MISFFSKFANAILHNLAIVTLLLFSFAFGVWHVFTVNPGTWDSAVALLLLALFSGISALLCIPRGSGNKNDRIVAFIFLLFAFISLLVGTLYSLNFLKEAALLPAACAIVLERSGSRAFRLTLLPLTLGFVALPMLEELTLGISFPLRLISTEFTVALLSVAGMEISSSYTTIYMPETAIAITDACSGVGQLGVLLFFAWLMGRKSFSSSLFYKIVRFLALLPIVIIANVIRLIVTILLYRAIGDRAFENDIHIALGYFFVIISLLMLYFFDKIIELIVSYEPEDELSSSSAKTNSGVCGDKRNSVDDRIVSGKMKVATEKAKDESVSSVILKQVLRGIFIIAGIYPIVSMIPYIVNAWKKSPLDAYDWSFVVFAVIVFMLRFKRFYNEAREKKNGVFNYYFSLIVLVGYILFIIGGFYSIHLVEMSGALVVLWGVAGMLFGLKFAIHFLPLIGILALATPSSRYWLEVSTGIDGLWFKGISAVLFAFVTFFLSNKNMGRVVFYAGIFVFCVLFLNEPVFTPYAALALNFESLEGNGFIGREIQPYEQDMRFFGKSNIKRTTFADEKFTLGVLSVSDFEDVHKVHPAGHCLKSSGHDVLSDRNMEVRFQNGKVLQINECIATLPNRDNVMLVWTWYGNDEFSTGNFIYFRKNYSSLASWSSYQIAVNCKENAIDEARKTLQRFIETFDSTN